MNTVTIHHSPQDIVRLCAIPKAQVDGRSVRPWPPGREGRNAPRHGGRDGVVPVSINSPMTTRKMTDADWAKYGPRNNVKCRKTGFLLSDSDIARVSKRRRRARNETK